MGRKPDKYGSPFDPMKKTPREERIERVDRMAGYGEPFRAQDIEQRIVCGNPNCAECYPGGVSTRRGASTQWSSRDLERMRENSIFGPTLTMEDIRGAWDAINRAADTPKPKGPPASYTAAREKVKEWIAPAPEQSFDEIVGNEEALEQLRDAIQAPVKHAELYAAYGMKMPKGALLSGPPGCGKTMFARAAAAEMKRLYGDTTEFISIAGSELQSPYIGVTEGYIKDIFAFAREYKTYHGHPLLVFMDEAEVLLPDRTGRVRRVMPWEESQVATFLAEMDGMRASGAFVLLATNRPEVIDQAVLRDGRCDFKITVKRPTAKSVELILEKSFAGVLLGADTAEALVFAALESLHDPHKVIIEAHAIGIDFEEQKVDTHDKHFLLSHIVSGAMAASIPARATRLAFARDKLDGVAKGVTVADVVKAVNDLFEENKNLDHAFALNEFRQEFMAELRAKHELKEHKGGKGAIN